MPNSRTITFSDAGIPVMVLPEVPHATLSSALTQGVVSATVAYPLLFESTEDILGMYRQSSAFTCNLASPATVTWAAHKLSIGAAVVFSGLTGATGITAGTVYYIATTNFTTGSFELSTTFGGVGNVNTSATGSGTATCVSRLYANEPGDYLFNLSSVLNTTNNTAAIMDVWFVKGNSTDNLSGTNVAKSNTQAALDSNGTQVVISVPLVIDLLLAGDYVRLDYKGSANTIQWLAIAAASSPDRPSMPSVILVVNKIGS